MSVSGESEKLVALDLVGESLKADTLSVGLGRADGGNEDRSRIPADCFAD